MQNTEEIFDGINRIDRIREREGEANSRSGLHIFLSAVPKTGNIRCFWFPSWSLGTRVKYDISYSLNPILFIL